MQSNPSPRILYAKRVLRFEPCFMDTFPSLAIMNPNRFFFRSSIPKWVASGGGIFLLASAFAQPLSAQGIEFIADEAGVGRHAKNLARHHLGAKFVAMTGASAAEAAVLLTEEVAVGYPLPAGFSEMVIALASIESLEGLRFANAGAAGKVTVRTSEILRDAGDAGWSSERFAVFQANDPVVKVPIGWEDAKYLHVRFDVAKPGEISTFGVFSDRDATDYELAPLVNVPDANGNVAAGDSSDRSEITSSDIDVATLTAGARVVYSSGGEGDPNAVLDQDPATVLAFGEAGVRRVLVIELGQDFDIDRVGIMLAESENLDVYVYSLSEYEGGAPDLTGLEPDGVVDVSGVRGSETLGGGTSGRYIVLVFTGTGENSPFEVVEIGLYLTEESAREYGVIPGISDETVRQQGLLEEPSAFRFGPLGFAGSNFLRRGGLRGAADRLATDVASGSSRSGTRDTPRSRTPVATAPASP